MHLLYFFTGTKDAFVPPEILQIVTANPFAGALEFIRQSRHETMFFWQVLL